MEYKNILLVASLGALLILAGVGVYNKFLKDTSRIVNIDDKNVNSLQYDSGLYYDIDDVDLIYFKYDDTQNIQQIEKEEIVWVN